MFVPSLTLFWRVHESLRSPCHCPDGHQAIYLCANSDSISSWYVVALISRLCRADAGSSPGANALIPEFNTTGVNGIKNMSQMFLNSWQTLWQKQKRVFNTEMLKLKETAVVSEDRGWQMNHVFIFHLALRGVLHAFQVIHFLNFSLTGKLVWSNSTSSKRENTLVPHSRFPPYPAFSSTIWSSFSSWLDVTAEPLCQLTRLSEN